MAKHHSTGSGNSSSSSIDPAQPPIKWWRPSGSLPPLSSSVLPFFLLSLLPFSRPFIHPSIVPMLLASEILWLPSQYTWPQGTTCKWSDDLSFKGHPLIWHVTPGMTGRWWAMLLHHPKQLMWHRLQRKQAEIRETKSTNHQTRANIFTPWLWKQSKTRQRSSGSTCFNSLIWLCLYMKIYYN